MGQAARLLGLRTDGLRRWIDGYERAGRTCYPVIRPERTGDDTITWGEFVEAGCLREYRAKRVSLQYLRPVIALLRKARELVAAGEDLGHVARIYDLPRSDVVAVVEYERHRADIRSAA